MRVVVIGGGVAGSAAAAALARVGAQVTVYEADQDPAGPVGSFLSLAANGLKALDALGPECARDVADAGFPVWHQRMWSAHGKLLAQVPRNRRAGDPRPSVTVRRADLVALLRAAARREGAQIVTGRRISEPGDLGDLGGGPANEADLVVGADGMWSVTRTLLNPDAAAPRYAGLYSVSGTAAMGAAAATTETGVFNMVFSRGGVFIHLTAPDGTIWWNAQIADPRKPSREQLARTGPAVLAKALRDCDRARAILEHADIDSRTLSHVLPETPCRHDGDRVLIGDAVHPVGAGQGASMALEDAVVLARLLAARAVSGARGGPGLPGIPERLAAFDAARQKRLRKMTAAARRNRDAKTMGALQARARDLVMPHVFPRAYPAATNWLYDFEPGTLPK
jgi:salicylate hydroxylase